ncbi:rhomboid-like protein [Kitasatospora sp. NPDC049258]|uniref:rhomboid-like protein n=1 Tax=Kitasatospora sp. NPDC049258 TaxID=3155394 RepID=UPI003412A4D9
MRRTVGRLGVTRRSVAALAARAPGALRRWARATPGALWRWIRAAPGTYVWLLLLAITSLIVTQIKPASLDWFLAKRSTNLEQLRSRPVHALVASAIWTERANFPFYFVVFHLFNVPAERWLGTRRWLTVALTAHVLATLISEGVVAWGVETGRLSPGLADTVDVGVSYALAGVQGVLTYRFAGRWRLLYGGAVLTFYLVPLVVSHTFTDLGHFCAVLIGLGFHRMTRGRPTWDPARTWRSWRRRLRPRPPATPPTRADARADTTGPAAAAGPADAV